MVMQLEERKKESLEVSTIALAQNDIIEAARQSITIEVLLDNRAKTPKIDSESQVGAEDLSRTA